MNELELKREPKKKLMEYINDLQNGDDKIKQQLLAGVLNQQPPPEWIRIHPITKSKYLDIGRVEFLLTQIFKTWWVEIKSSEIVANSIQVTIRLFYKSVLNDEILWTDGIGAAPMLTKAGSSAIDFNNILSNAVQMAAPMAKTYAIKDAAETIGEIFGASLSRINQYNYDNLLNVPVMDLNKLKLKIIEVLDSYKGDDKDFIKETFEEKIRAKEFDYKFGKNLLLELGVQI